MKPKTRLFSRIDWLCVMGFVIMLAFLFSFPFWNINNRALLQMTQKKYEKAEKIWHKALGKQPFSPLYRMNLAFNYMLWENPEKAIQEYAVTRKLIGDFVSFRIREYEKSKQKKIHKPGTSFVDSTKEKTFFNSAISAVQNGKIDKALHFYQQALSLNSESLNPESLRTKTNIELLVTSNPSKNKEQEKEKKKKSASRKEEKKNKSEATEQKSENKDSQDKGKEKEKTGEQEKDKGKEKGKEKEKTGDQEKDNKKPKENNQEEQSQGQQGEEEEQSQGQQGEEQKETSSNLYEEQKNHDNKNSQREQENFIPENQNNQKLNQKQTEVILKAILEQEKNIRERRQRERKRRPVIKKDW